MKASDTVPCSSCGYWNAGNDLGCAQCGAGTEFRASLGWDEEDDEAEGDDEEEHEDGEEETDGLSIDDASDEHQRLTNKTWDVADLTDNDDLRLTVAIEPSSRNGQPVFVAEVRDSDDNEALFELTEQGALRLAKALIDASMVLRKLDEM